MLVSYVNVIYQRLAAKVLYCVYLIMKHDLLGIDNVTLLMSLSQSSLVDLSSSNLSKISKVPFPNKDDGRYSSKNLGS